MIKMEKNTVMIGDLLGTIEEFMPGEGTYAEDGKIYASNIGKAVIDRENHVVRIEGKIPPEIKIGQVVFGDVMRISKNIITVIVRRIKGYDMQMDIKTGIYVSQIADGYVKRPEDMFGIGDIVIGKVIKIDQGLIDITTKGSFGVVKAFCKRCRAPLVRTEKYKDKLLCPSCGSNEMRKIANDYGVVSEI